MFNRVCSDEHPKIKTLADKKFNHLHKTSNLTKTPLIEIPLPKMT